jgi:hypothetical protein
MHLCTAHATLLDTLQASSSVGPLIGCCWLQGLLQYSTCPTTTTPTAIAQARYLATPCIAAAAGRGEGLGGTILALGLAAALAFLTPPAEGFGTTIGAAGAAGWGSGLAAGTGLGDGCAPVVLPAAGAAVAPISSGLARSGASTCVLLAVVLPAAVPLLPDVLLVPLTASASRLPTAGVASAAVLLLLPAVALGWLLAPMGAEPLVLVALGWPMTPVGAEALVLVALS